MKKLPVRHLGVLVCVLGLVSPVDLRASAPAPAPAPDPNLRLAGSENALVEGDLAVFVVSETAQGGRDLNGDGDADDERVVHVFDARRRAARSLAVALDSGFFPLGLSPRLLVVPVSEVRQGHRDLNGDGDALDEGVLHVLDRSEGTLVNFGLQSVQFDTLRADGRRFVARVDEAGQGSRDLNGDGDAIDTVLHVIDVGTRSVRNVGLAVDPLQFALEGGNFAFAVSEAMQGQVDLNGDGDAEDVVLHVLDVRRGRVRSAGLDAQGGFQLDADRLVLPVRESTQGQDLNGDGDLDDFVLHLVDATTAAVRNLRLAAGAHRLREGRLLFAVSEESQGGVDLNGDGDAADHVAHLIELPRLEPTNLRLAGSDVFLIGSGAVLGIEERMQGGTDLNGDGDVFDTVVHMFSRRRARDLVNTRLAAEPLVGGVVDEDAPVFPFVVSEEAQGGRDLNGDGDAEDRVLHAADPGRGRALSSGLASLIGTLPVQGDRVVVPVFEFAQGQQDLDGDGLPFSVVPHVFDAATGATLNSRLPVLVAGFFPAIFLAGGFFSLLAPEGSTDRNGDGDTLDSTLTLVDLGTVAPTRAPFAVVGLGFPPDFGGTGTVGPALGDAFIFAVSEDAQGQRDLNGDGDTDDSVFHAVRLEDRNRDRIFDFVQD